MRERVSAEMSTLGRFENLPPLEKYLRGLCTGAGGSSASVSELSTTRGCDAPEFGCC